jgi:hypothetical protein
MDTLSNARSNNCVFSLSRFSFLSSLFFFFPTMLRRPLTRLEVGSEDDKLELEAVRKSKSSPSGTLSLLLTLTHSLTLTLSCMLLHFGVGNVGWGRC